MKILQVYNQRKALGGEDRMVEFIDKLMTDRGHTVSNWLKSNDALADGLGEKVGAFFSGIYSPRTYAEACDRLRRDQPDVVHVHNLYPYFSASLLRACTAVGVHTIVHVHSHFLTCPIATHFHDTVCHKCLSGHGLACVTQNCRNNIAESVGYAARFAAGNAMGAFRAGNIRLLTMSRFARERLCSQGYRVEAISVIPNAVNLPKSVAVPRLGTYIAYAGRLSAEKGIGDLIGAARTLGLPVVVAGETNTHESIVADAPSNVSFTGHLDREGLAKLYEGAQFAVVPSAWEEPFGLAAAEAMSFGLPVIAADIGALGEVVEDGKTGYLYRSGAPTELCDRIARLWNNGTLLTAMGAAARMRVEEHYSEDVYYQELLGLYLAR